MKQRHVVPLVSSVLVLSILAIAPAGGAARRFQDLYRPSSARDAANPNGPLTIGASGILYGSSYDGGAYGLGTVFRLVPSPAGYVATIAYSFAGWPTDGAWPMNAGLVVDKTGAIYGTTSSGGFTNSGIAFKLTPTAGGYQETILHSFQGSPNDGSTPQAPLIADSNGTLFGTTSAGGSGDRGTVFALRPAGSNYTMSVLHSFQGSDGYRPVAGLMMKRDGTLYGTTYGGGSAGLGTVFRLTPSGSSYSLTSLHSFSGHQIDGKQPVAGVVADRKGTLYGTTIGGGQYFAGTVFKLTPSGSGYAESVIHNFARRNAANPATGIVIGSGGILYGTTTGGGAYGDGTIFSLTPSRNGFVQSTLHTFSGVDGANPRGDLIFGPGGDLFGTAYEGGGTGGCGPSSDTGCGSVFKLNRAPREVRR